MIVNLKEIEKVRSADKYQLPELPAEMFPISEYDEVHINVSGGADSVATTLIALHDFKIPKEKIKLVHIRVYIFAAIYNFDVHDPTYRRSLYRTLVAMV